MDIQQNELYMESVIDMEAFQAAFMERFPGGKIELVKENARRPGERYVSLIIPLSERENLLPFYREFCEKQRLDLRQGPRGTYPAGDE